MVKLVKKYIKYIINIYKSFLLKKNNILVHPSCSINKSKFNAFIKIYENTKINNSFIDSYSYIHKNCILNNVNIGKFCSIAPNIEIIYGSHPLNFISTHPAFYSTRKQSGISFTNEQIYNEFNYIKGTNKSCIIGNDVWIGYGAKIIEGIKINDGAVVLAGAIVTKDVEAYSIVGGIPAKHIKYRFSEDEIEQLLEFKWWNKNIDWFKDNYKLFINQERFFDEINNS